MSNHYHLVLETPEPTLSRGLRRLHGTYTQLCRYVLLNPVRAGLVGDTSEWVWSSYRATAGLQESPDWLDVPSVLALFDRSASTAQAAYRRFVADGAHHPSPWRDVTGQIYLGSPEFLEPIDRLARSKSLVNVPSAQGRPTRLSADEVLKQVAAAYRVRLGALLDRSHREAYQTAVYLLRRAANEPLQTVAIRFRISPSCISKIQRDVEASQLTPAQIQAFHKRKVKNCPSLAYGILAWLQKAID